jgi:hypothetical protein
MKRIVGLIAGAVGVRARRCIGGGGVVRDYVAAQRPGRQRGRGTVSVEGLVDDRTAGLVNQPMQEVWPVGRDEPKGLAAT